jgi:crossover junction endodeoxyribonuclease RuvC
VHIGIDPGLSGAVAVLSDDGILVSVHDMPVLTLKVARGTRHEYDAPGLMALLEPYSGPQSHVIIEEAQAMPGQGTRSMFTTGLGFGLWLGILGALAPLQTGARAGTREARRTSTRFPAPLPAWRLTGSPLWPVSPAWP